MKRKALRTAWLLVSATAVVACGGLNQAPVPNQDPLRVQPMSSPSAGTELVSVASDGAQANYGSYLAAISADGRHVAFGSGASNLVPGDRNDLDDVFVRDRQSGVTELVSVASDGTQGNRTSEFPTISGDGRYVAFSSSSDSLVAMDTNDASDVFLRDRATGETTLVSVATDGTHGNYWSDFPSISSDGRYVAFHSYANNLVPGDTNQTGDIFVRDRQAGTTERVSVSTDGTQGNNDSELASISGDGRFVAFHSNASNLVPDDTNDRTDIFVRDRHTGVTERVSLATDGTEGNGYSDSPSISAYGRYVAFTSEATNLVSDDTNSDSDVFVRDRQTGETERASIAADGTQGNFGGSSHSISADGRYVAFASGATNLVEDDTNDRRDVFVRDRQAKTTLRVSVSSDGAQGNGDSRVPSLSSDGRYVSFLSYASNLVTDDANDAPDVFVHNLGITPPEPQPEANPGFVTGGGWIDSQAGACTRTEACASVTGKATFHIVAKNKDATAPHGHVTFTFNRGQIQFRSTRVDGFAIDGNRAEISGDGTLNGTPSYAFLLTVVAARTNGDTGAAIRIRIWDATTGHIAYDTQPGADDDAGPTTPLGGGSIVIHLSNR